MSDSAEETERVLALLEGASGSLMCPTEYAMVAVREARRLALAVARLEVLVDGRDQTISGLHDEIRDMQRNHQAEITDLHHDHVREMNEAGAELRAMERELQNMESQTDDYGVWGR